MSFFSGHLTALGSNDQRTQQPAASPASPASDLGEDTVTLEATTGDDPWSPCAKDAMAARPASPPASPPTGRLRANSLGIVIPRPRTTSAPIQASRSLGAAPVNPGVDVDDPSVFLFSPSTTPRTLTRAFWSKRHNEDERKPRFNTDAEAWSFLGVAAPKAPDASATQMPANLVQVGKGGFARVYVDGIHAGPEITFEGVPRQVWQWLRLDQQWRLRKTQWHARGDRCDLTLLTGTPHRCFKVIQPKRTEGLCRDAATAAFQSHLNPTCVEMPSGLLVVAMDFIPYSISRLSREPLVQVLSVFAQVARQVHDTHHKLELVYADLKPRNVLLRRVVPKRQDGGDSQADDAFPKSNHSCFEPVLIDPAPRHSLVPGPGTPDYAAPESGAFINPKSDTFSLGWTVAVSLLGRACRPKDNMAAQAERYNPHVHAVGQQLGDHFALYSGLPADPMQPGAAASLGYEQAELVTNAVELWQRMVNWDGCERPSMLEVAERMNDLAATARRLGAATTAPPCPPEWRVWEQWYLPPPPTVRRPRADSATSSPGTPMMSPTTTPAPSRGPSRAASPQPLRAPQPSDHPNER